MLSFKKATLTTENETKDGVLVILEDHDCNSPILLITTWRITND